MFSCKKNHPCFKLGGRNRLFERGKGHGQVEARSHRPDDWTLSRRRSDIARFGTDGGRRSAVVFEVSTCNSGKKHGPINIEI